MNISMPVDQLDDNDLAELRRGYAACWHEETLPAGLRWWAWHLCLAFTEELERRQEVLQELADSLDDSGGIGDQVPDS